MVFLAPPGSPPNLSASFKLGFQPTPPPQGLFFSAISPRGEFRSLFTGQPGAAMVSGKDIMAGCRDLPMSFPRALSVMTLLMSLLGMLPSLVSAVDSSTWICLEGNWNSDDCWQPSPPTGASEAVIPAGFTVTIPPDFEVRLDSLSLRGDLAVKSGGELTVTTEVSDCSGQIVVDGGQITFAQGAALECTGLLRRSPFQIRPRLELALFILTLFFSGCAKFMWVFWV